VLVPSSGGLGLGHLCSWSVRLALAGRVGRAPWLHPNRPGPPKAPPWRRANKNAPPRYSRR
jgi:hypothetical protein